MHSVSINEIQRDLPGYLKRVEAGETLIVVSGNRVVAEIKPVEPNSGGSALRPAGLASGDFTVPADFDSPLPEEMLRGFEGS